MRLQTKLMAGIFVLVILIGLGFEATFKEMMEDNLKESKGHQALAIAKAVANMPEIQKAFLLPQPSTVIQPIAEQIRKQVDAEFIVVGNRQEIRYSHPNAKRIGKKMMGGDNKAVFKGKAIISESVGTLGPSLRGKAPILNDKNEVIGVVSVGFLQIDIQKEIKRLQGKIFLYTSLLLVGGLVAAILISFNIKKAIFGLEPREIAWMYQEKHAILESIHEGIIAIDADGDITVVNETAHKILGVPNDILLRGKPIEDVIKHTHLLQVVQTGLAEYDREFLIEGEVFVVNRIPIFDKRQQVIGAVASLRKKSELSKITQELSNVKAYAEGLRAQTHEYSNKLYTLLGLIQLGSNQEAIDFISKEVNVTQGFLHFITQEIGDPILAGFILGKVSLAHEMRIEFEINPESSFVDIPRSINRDSIVTIVGNLINNAFDAVKENIDREKKVTLFLTDLGRDLIIEVEDNGNGISTENEERIFQRGFSTKGGQSNAGIGLSLVQESLEGLDGYLTLSSEEGVGTVFTVVIPKKEGL